MGGRWWVVGGGWWVVGEPRPVAARNPHHLPPTTYHPLPVLLLLATLGAFGCSSSPPRAPAIAEAYAGPATLPLRKDIPLQAPVVATVKHGERLEIVQHRRRFMKVRTAGGVEGWTEDYLLLSAAEIAALKQVERRALTMPSQGAASTYELLNVHTEPNRFSPSFLQIKEGEKVDVLAHVSAPRTPPERKPLIPPRPRLAPARKHAEEKYPLPPMPTPPPPPKNWKELSRTPPEIAQEIAADRAAHAPPNDDWSLVRNSQGESGWVLTRRLYMAIPDEVAQYAEGHRITSYFPLTDVQDGDTVKHNWLWTTSAGGDHPYDFDSYRVFTWSLRRHRYETAFIQRNVEGYFPVLARPAGFSVCVVNGAGHACGAVTRLSRPPCVSRATSLARLPVRCPRWALRKQAVPNRPPAPPAGKPSFWGRLKTRIGRWFAR